MLSKRADRRGRNGKPVGVLAKASHARRRQVIGAGKRAAAADGPDHAARRSSARRLLDLIEKIERFARLAVHLVDEGHDRNVAQAADLEELARACLDALGGVDHHHRRINSGERAVGVLGKVFVARRVEQVEDAAVVFESHDRGHDRYAAGPLDRHPVGTRPPPVALGAHLRRQAESHRRTAGAFRSASSCRRPDAK